MYTHVCMCGGREANVCTRMCAGVWGGRQMCVHAFVYTCTHPGKGGKWLKRMNSVKHIGGAARRGRHKGGDQQQGHCCCICRVGQNYIHIRCVNIFLAGKSQNIRSYTLYIYGSGQPYAFGGTKVYVLADTSCSESKKRKLDENGFRFVDSHRLEGCWDRCSGYVALHHDEKGGALERAVLLCCVVCVFCVVCVVLCCVVLLLERAVV